jgi:hypothetical protein
MITDSKQIVRTWAEWRRYNFCFCMFLQLLQSDDALVAILGHLPLCSTDWTTYWELTCMRRAQVKVGLINLCKGLFSLNARIYYKLKSGT